MQELEEATPALLDVSEHLSLSDQSPSLQAKHMKQALITKFLTPLAPAGRMLPKTQNGA